MIRLETKNCNIIFTEKQQKYKHYHLEKLINRNILQLKKYHLLKERGREIEPGKFSYCPLKKDLEKQAKVIEDQGKKNK